VDKEVLVESLRNNIAIEFWKKGINCEIIFRINNDSSFNEFLNFSSINLIFFQFSAENLGNMINSINLIKSKDSSIPINIVFNGKIQNEKIVFKLYEMGCEDFYYMDDILNKSVNLLFPKREKDEIYKYLNLSYSEVFIDGSEVINEEAIKNFFENSIDYKTLLYEDFKYIYEGLGKKEKNHLLKKIKENKIIKLGKNTEKFMQGGIIAVWNNGEFASEISQITSRYLDKKVLLMDLDRLNPSIDLFSSKTNSKKMDTYFSDIGLYEIQETFFKNEEFEDFIFKNFSKGKKNKNLDIIYGEEDISRFEYFSNDMIMSFLDQVRKKYDFVILNLNDFIYDAYTCIGIIKSDVCIIPLAIDIEKLRKYNRYINFLKEKQGIDSEKFFYVFFEYSSKYYKNFDFYKGLLKDKLLGKISFSKDRLDCRNYKKPYIMMIKNSIKLEYMDILKKLHIAGEG